MKQIISMLLLLCSSSAVAQTTWYARTPGNWNGTIWATTPTGTPGSATIAATDNVIVQDGVALTTNVSGVTINNLTIGESATTALVIFEFPLTINGATTVRGTMTATTAVLPMVVMAGSLTLESGSTLINNGRRIDLSGNWTNNGATLSLFTQPVRFTGTAVQTIGGAASTTFNSIDNENTAGLTFNQDVTLAGFGNSYLDNSSVTVSASRTFTVGDGTNAHGFFPSVHTVGGAGNFVMNGLVNFHCVNPNGIIGTGSNGAIQVSGARTFSNAVTYYFERLGAQSTFMANPNAREVFFFGSGVKTLTEDITVSLQCIVQTNNTLNAGPFVISGASSFVLQNSATLRTANPNGVVGTGSNGTIRVTGVRTLNDEANYIFDRVGDQDLYFWNTTVGSVEIFNGGTKRLTENISVIGTFYVGGVLSCGTSVISGPGTFQLEPTGSTLIIGSSAGITAAPTNAGNIQTATRNFPAVDYWYRSNGAQSTGNGLPATLRRLIIENTGTPPNNITSLTNSTTVSGASSFIRLISGVLNTGANLLTLSNDDPASLELFGGRIAGTFRRAIQTTGTPTYIFPIGTTSSDRAASVSFTTAPGGTSPTLTASFQDADPGGAGLGALGLVNYWNGGFWRIDQTGSPTGAYNLSLNASGVSGIGVPTTVRILRRPSLSAAWTDAAAPSGSSTVALIQTGSPFSGFSEFGLGGGADNPLPVELLSFDARQSGETVVLNWRTASEVNNAGFDVERKTARDSWQTLGFVRGNGTTATMQSYQFIDGSTEVGTAYSYRLKQIDFDGKFVYSPVVSIEMRQLEPAKTYRYSLEQNFPNPFNPTTIIRFTMKEAGAATLTVTDVLGRTVMTQPLNARLGENQVVFNAMSLGSGIYFYTLNAQGFSQTRKMMLVK